MSAEFNPNDINVDDLAPIQDDQFWSADRRYSNFNSVCVGDSGYFTRFDGHGYLDFTLSEAEKTELQKRNSIGAVVGISRSRFHHDTEFSMAIDGLDRSEYLQRSIGHVDAVQEAVEALRGSIIDAQIESYTEQTSTLNKYLGELTGDAVIVYSEGLKPDSETTRLAKLGGFFLRTGVNINRPGLILVGKDGKPALEPERANQEGFYVGSFTKGIKHTKVKTLSLRSGTLFM